MRFLFLFLLLAGCTTVPSVNNTVAATAETIAVLSDQADLANKRGWLDDASELDIQVKLLDALDLLDTGIALNTGECAKTRQECVQDILLEVEMKLREVQP